MAEKQKTITPITWDEFRSFGMFWWVNSVLHLFGLAIVCEVDENNKISKVYPARAIFRGFHDESEQEGFKVVTKYLENNIDKLKDETLIP